MHRTMRALCSCLLLLLLLSIGVVSAPGTDSGGDVEAMVLRLRRAVARERTVGRRSRNVVVVNRVNGTNGGPGRCVISADQAAHFCGFAEEVNTPPIVPPQAGACHRSAVSGREICFPRYEDLDTSCTDSHAQSNVVAPLTIPHASVQTMAFLPPDRLRRLIRQYYRQLGQHVPLKNESSILNPETSSVRPFLFVRYLCDYGYELIDEVDTMFCRDKSWEMTEPVCRGKGLCAHNNGGCSHSCVYFENNNTMECRCPRGMMLDDRDGKTCIRRVPTNQCRRLSRCTCTQIDDRQYTCNCPDQQCLLLKGAPRLFIEPNPPYEVAPGGSLNVTCAAAAYPFPEIYWQKGYEQVEPQSARQGTVKSEQVLMIKEIYKNAEFTCRAANSEGSSQHSINVVVTGPGSSPIFRRIDPARSSIAIHWDQPQIVNRPITSYTLYYTTNPSRPIDQWEGKLQVDEPQRHAIIRGLQHNTTYTLRMRANDNKGMGKLSGPISANTRVPAKRPILNIQEGAELRVAPRTPFSISCNVTSADPIPQVLWEARGRPITLKQESRYLTLQHTGLYENSDFTCVAENEAGRSSTKVSVIVTGPTSPEKVRYHVDGNKVHLQWEEPRITNAPMENYEILYTTDPELPEEQWSRVMGGGPDSKSFVLPDLEEKQDYTIRIKGHNINGPGLPSSDFKATTWLAPRRPLVTLSPSEPIRLSPSLDELVVQCEASGVPKPKIIWFWDNVPIEDGKDSFRIYDIAPLDAQDRAKSKVIAEATARSGLLKCQAVNDQGAADGVLPIKILGPGSGPMHIHPRTEQNGIKIDWKPPLIPNGEITKYLIYYTDDPNKELADWEIRDVDGAAEEAQIDGLAEDRPYFVRMQATTTDGPGIISDEYEVKTGLKHIPLRAELQVISPEVGEAKEVTVDPQQSITFKCVAKGRPQPSIFYTWFPVDHSESGQEPIYVEAIRGASEHEYVTQPINSSTSTPRSLSCVAKNIHGSINSNPVVFNVVKPGSPPRDISSTVDVDNSVKITWHPPIHPNGAIKNYKVYLSADASKSLDQWQSFTVRATSEEPMLEFGRGELEPETPYYIRISSENADGEGVVSDIASFTTLSGAPLDSPTDVLPSVALDNSANVSWTAPSQPNGPLKLYTIYFTPVDPSVRDEDYRRWTKIEIPTTTEETGGFAQIDKDRYSLLPDHDYQMRVSATNDQGEGPASGIIRFTTGSGEIPPSIRFEPTTNPVLVEPRAGYSVTCQASGVPPPRITWSVGGERLTEPTLSLHTIIKDTSATCYAENSAGSAHELLEIHVAGPGTPPAGISITALPDQTISVEWGAPDEPNGPLSGFVVHYGEIADGETEPREWTKHSIEGGDNLSHKITGLKPKTRYGVKVQAMSDRGEGVLSEPAIATRTLPLAPAAPVVSDVTVQDNNTVVLRFDAPHDPTDPAKRIKQYRILYTAEDPLLEEAKWRELVWSVPEDEDLEGAEVTVPINPENFDPETKYTVKVIPQGEVDGLPSHHIAFQTGDGIIAPERPILNVQTEDGGVIRVPAGTDLSVLCTAAGTPPPTITWIDGEGQISGENGWLRVFDMKETKSFTCRAENPGGREEIPFTIYVSGPGNAPENISLEANRPKSIDVFFDPPTIPNGDITRYIVYYTPLDDQDRGYQVGQVPSKPIREWMSYHMVASTPTGDELNEGRKHVLLTDFVEPDTAYALVIQAANPDGPGPYSAQYTIRTMSKARAGPPTELLVEPLNQSSVEARWKPADTIEEAPISYELFYIPAEKSIEEDELLSLPKWNKVSVGEPDTLLHRIENELLPDTEYVFKIRAIYDSGPGVFSEPCIVRTLPEGDLPHIVVSAGGGGLVGTTEMELLPGSAYSVFCQATGQPKPSVKWIRGGDMPIDPSTVKSDESGTRWFLKLENITKDTTFICVARNSLGVANWTIDLKMLKDLPPDWESAVVSAENKNGTILLHFADDKMPSYLREPNDWTIRYTPMTHIVKPMDEWSAEESKDRKLTTIPVQGLEAGSTYLLSIENNKDGIRTPVFTILVPKPPSDIRVGTNINDERIVDFRSAITSIPVERYLIKYWPVGKGEAEGFTPMVTEAVGDKTLGHRITEELLTNTEYYFQVVAELANGRVLSSEPILVKTPPEEIKCECSHACRLIGDEKSPRVECYCPEGYELSEDQRTCRQVEGAETEFAVVHVTTPASDVESEHPSVGPQRVETSSTPSPAATPLQSSPLPTDAYGQVAVTVSTVPDKLPYPTDSLGRRVVPIVYFNGSAFTTDAEGNQYDPLGRQVLKNDEEHPLDPNGEKLILNDAGNYVYPPLDRNGDPLPTDVSFRPLHTVVDGDGREFPKDAAGRSLNEGGEPFPTDFFGQPVGVDSSPLPTDDVGRYRVLSEEPTGLSPVPTDAMGYEIFPIVGPDGSPLPTAAQTGLHLDPITGTEIERNEQGIPVDSQGKPLPKDEKEQYVYSYTPTPPTEREQTKADGEPAEEPSRPEEGGSTPRPTYPIVDSNGHPLPTDSLGRYVDAESGAPIPIDSQGTPYDARTGETLMQNEDGSYVHVERATTTQAAIIPTTTTTTRPSLVIVGPDGLPLPTNAEGLTVGTEGHLYSTDAEGLPLGPDSSPLPTNLQGQFIAATAGGGELAVALPTDDNGKLIHPIIGDDGQLLPTDSSQRYVDPVTGEQIPVDDYGRPINSKGAILPTSGSEWQYLYTRPSASPTTGAIGPDGVPLPTDKSGLPIVAYPDDREATPAGKAGKKNCQLHRAAADIVFAINDELLQYNGDRVKQAISQLLTDHLDLEPDVTRIAILHYGKGVEIPVNLGGYQERGEALEKLQSIEHSSALGVPALSVAYNAAVQQFTVFSRRDVNKLLIVFGAGADILPDLNEEARALKSQSITPILIGLTGYTVEIEAANEGLNIFFEEWTNLDASKIKDSLEAECKKGSLPLPSQRIPTVSDGETSSSLANRLNPLGLSSECLALQRRTKLILLVETSTATVDSKSQLQRHLMAFTRGYVQSAGKRQIGIIYYGATVEVAADVGNYDAVGELVDAVEDMHFVGGLPDTLLAIKTAHQLFSEEDTEEGTFIKLVLHMHSSVPPPATQQEIDRVLNDNRIVVLDLERDRWSSLDNPPLRWASQLCLLETAIDKGGLPSPASVNKLLFGGGSTSPRPTDASGQTVAVTEGAGGTTSRILPTDAMGMVITPIYGPDGKLLERDEEGRYVNARGEQIELDTFGRPLGDDGQVLPINNLGQYIYLEGKNGIGEIIHTKAPTPTVVVIGPDGIPLPTDPMGQVVDRDKQPLPTNNEGLLVGPDKSPLPTNSMGQYLLAGDEQTPHLLPTDVTGRFIYPIVDRDTGALLETDSEGRYIDVNGELVPTDDFGRPVDSSGGHLPTNAGGQYLFKQPPSLSRPTGAPQQPATTSSAHSVGPDWQLASTDASGKVVDEMGWPYPTSADGLPLGPEGSPLPTNEEGLFLVAGSVYDPERERGRVLPTDESGLSVESSLDSRGQYAVVPEDEQSATTPLPTNIYGKLVYPIVDAKTGRQLEKDDSGSYMDRQGQLIPTDYLGRPLDDLGQILPTNARGEFIYGGAGQVVTPSTEHKEIPRPTNEVTMSADEKERPTYPIVGSDGQLLPKDSEGRYLTVENGELVPTDDHGRPLDSEGRILPTNSAGDYVFILPVDEGLTTSAIPPEEVTTEESKTNTAASTAERKAKSKYCFVSGSIELLLVFDTSSNVKLFLLDNFDLNKVRVGLLKYGESVEVPIALGGYGSESELLNRIGDTRRVKGPPNLEEALREAASEFVLSGVDNVPRVVIVWKNGNSTTNPKYSADVLREKMGAYLYVVAVGDASADENEMIVGEGNAEDRVMRLKQWKGVDTTGLGVIANRLCQAIPSAVQEGELVSTPKPRPRPTPSAPAECYSIDKALDLIVLFDSSSTNDQEFSKVLEGIGSFIDESFDLSPDAVRIGFIVYSDKVSVPVALGHYEDKIELLSEITDSVRLSGTAVIIRALDAAKQQFQLHSQRANVKKAVLLITNGKHRSNAANVAKELRDSGVEIYMAAVNPLPERHASLLRIVGEEFAEQRLLRLSSYDQLNGVENRLASFRRSLCAGTKPIGPSSRRIGKRDINYAVGSNSQSKLERGSTLGTQSASKPLCKDGLLRPYQITIVADTTRQSKLKDFTAVFNLLTGFLRSRFSARDQLLDLNFLAVNHRGIVLRKEGMSMGEFSEFSIELHMEQNDIKTPAQLLLALETAAKMENPLFASSTRIALLVSMDGQSSGSISDVINATEGIGVVGISLGPPISDLLKSLSGNRSSRVIHFDNWTQESVSSGFDRWLAHAICEITQTQQENRLAQAKKATSMQTPLRGESMRSRELRSPLPNNGNQDMIITRLQQTSPNSIHIAWTCSSDQLDNHYAIHFTSDPTLQRNKWQAIEPQNCQGSHGEFKLQGLSANKSYTVCVTSIEKPAMVGCSTLYLDEEHSHRGETVIKAICPAGFVFKDGECQDVDECKSSNGRCSHGCVNTLGDYYCACPYGMLLDPGNPKECIKSTTIFSRVVDLLAQYLFANVQEASVETQQQGGENAIVSSAVASNVSTIKVTVESGDNRTLTFEWSQALKRALQWVAP